MTARTFRPVRMSAMQAAHVALGASFTEIGTETGEWRVPVAYGASPEEEVRRARAGVGLADASACGKIEVRGDQVPALLAKPGGLTALPAGSARRAGLGGADVLAARLAPDQLLVLTRPADTTTVTRLLAEAVDGLGCGHLWDLSAGFAAVDLVGPHVPRLLARLVPLDLGAVPPLGVVQGGLARVPAILIRLDRPGLPLVRALVGRECGAFVWEALVEAGHDLGLVPVGATARALLDGGV